MHTAKRVHWFLASELLHIVGNKNDDISEATWTNNRSSARCSSDTVVDTIRSLTVSRLL